MRWRTAGERHLICMLTDLDLLLRTVERGIEASLGKRGTALKLELAGRDKALEDRTPWGWEPLVR